MPRTFHLRSRLSICALSSLAALTVAAHSSATPKAANPYYGRWTVSEDRPIFTARGRLYKTLDVAACGRGFCGISVDDKGICGATLFRFARHPEVDLLGHGKWGDAVKNIQISWDEGDPDHAATTMELSLGDGHDFGGRSGNMPKFRGEYRRVSEARCLAR